MFICGVVGVAVGATAAMFSPWQLATLLGWCSLASLLLLWVWLEIAACDATRTRARSTVEDSSRTAATLVMVTASVVSLVGVALALVKAHQVGVGLEIALTSLSLAAVMLSWCVVHTMFTLHYAHQYYREPVGGLEIPGGEAPDYRDFAYFSFAIGVSFATSDIDISGRSIRRIALRHALLSYLFGAVIVGIVINVMASFIQ